MNPTVLRIDVNESFESLPSAPCVEAVIHWRARAGRTLEPKSFLRELIEKLPDYPFKQRQLEFRVGGESGPEGCQVEHKQTWQGYHFRSSDNRYIAQFTRNGFGFSRLSPHEDWTKFQSEAMRLWKIYCELAEPSEIQRLGVRYINSIPAETMENLPDLLVVPPAPPSTMSLPIQEFMHQTRYALSDYGYSLNVIQTIQPASDDRTFKLILDLDAHTENTVEMAETELVRRLAEMRWIKNKAFFSILTPQAIARFRE